MFSCQAHLQPQFQQRQCPLKVKAHNHPVLSQEQCEASIKEFFTEDKVHNYYTCFNQCSKATEQELQRTKPKNLNHDWVEKINN